MITVSKFRNKSFILFRFSLKFPNFMQVELISS